MKGVKNMLGSAFLSWVGFTWSSAMFALATIAAFFS